MNNIFQSLILSTNNWTINRKILLILLAVCCQFFIVVWALSAHESGLALISYLLGPVILAASILGGISGLVTSFATLLMLLILRKEIDSALIFGDVVYLFWLIVISIIIGAFRTTVIRQQEESAEAKRDELCSDTRQKSTIDKTEKARNARKYLVKFENAEDLLEITSRKDISQLLNDFMKYLSEQVEAPFHFDKMSDDQFIFSILSDKFSANEIQEMVSGLNRSDISQLLLNANIRNTTPKPSNSLAPFQTAKKSSTYLRTETSSSNIAKKESKKSVVNKKITLDDFESALKREELFLEFQPRLDIISGRFTGIEALVRWSKRNGEVVYPKSFLEFIENSRFSLPFNKWLIDQVISLMEERIEKGKNIAISFNLSSRELFSDSIVDYLRKRLLESRVKPSRLGVEINESAFKRAIDSSRESLDRMRELGVEIIVDGYGAQHFDLFQPIGLGHFDAIKLDSSFLTLKIRDDQDENNINNFYAKLNKNKVRLILKNVEIKDHLRLIKVFGADEVQGYLIARPFRKHMIPWARFV